MKNFIILASIFISLSSYSQVFMDFGPIESDEEISSIQDGYRSSALVKDFVESTERRFNVKCDDYFSIRYSGLSARVSLKTKCDGESPVKIKIVSSVMTKEGSALSFKLIKEFINLK